MLVMQKLWEVYSLDGLWTIFGPILTVAVAIITKNVIVAIFFGICYLSIGMNGVNFLGPLTDYFIQGINENGFILIILIPLGVMLCFMRIGGGYKAFANLAHKKVNNRKQASTMVFLLAAVLGSGNDLISNLATGKILKPVIVQNRLSFYKSAYISASVGPNIATPFPYSTYFIFCIAMISMLVPDVNAIRFFFQSIGLSVHTWLAVILAFLAAREILPDLGLMKKHQVEAATQTIDETNESEDLSAIGGEEVKADLAAFVLPLVVMVIAMIATSIVAGEVTVAPGAFIAAISAVVYTLIRGSVKPKDVGKYIVTGFVEMAPIFLLLTFAFAFGAQLKLVGFSDFIVNALSGSLSPAITPLISFLLAVAIGYTTGSLGSALIIMMPLAFPLGIAVGANLPLTFAAVYSGSQWGDQTSPISDVLIENSGANDVDPVGLFRAMMPYRFISLGACIVVFTLLGFVMKP